MVLTNPQKEQAYKLWGHPATLADITKLFSQFCEGRLAALPWSDSAPSAETSVIASQLAKLNELGFLTINSQPAVDGVRSDDKTHGWGPSGCLEKLAAQNTKQLGINHIGFGDPNELI